MPVVFLCAFEWLRIYVIVCNVAICVHFVLSEGIMQHVLIYFVIIVH